MLIDNRVRIKQLTEGLVVSVGIVFFSFPISEKEDLFAASIMYWAPGTKSVPH